MRRSVIAVGLCLAITVAGALAWPDRSGSTRSSQALSSDAGPSSLVEKNEGGMEMAADPLSPSTDAGALVWQEPEEDFRSRLLPSTSPSAVRFGVILVQYRGAEVASPTTRSRAEALVLARSIAEAAKSDFKGQIARGDPGSTADAGKIPRGVLEPSTEYGVFRLAPREVSDPIDTPRGFWIVQRIE